ncbi:MAG: hypothetical protein N2Z21_04085 [Candidatus Sumerlaeaceae bacterium]|nr:hypothetical protein [Candidatus Sumerlaeaceae bacterium]
MAQKESKLVLVIIAASLPPIALLLGLICCFVNVPYLDQWWLLPLLVAQRSGTLTCGLIWLQNAEHRLFFPKLLMLGLAQWSHWDLRWEVAFNVFLSFCALGLIYAHYSRLFRLIRTSFSPWWLVLGSFIVFSYAPFENWLWSWQLPYFLIQCCVLVCCWALSYGCRHFFSWLIALGSAVVASYSFATGFAVYGAGMVVIMVVWPRPTKLQATLLWLLAFTITLSIYLSGYEFLRWNDPLGAVTRISHFLGYVLVYLGAALVPTHWVGLAIVGGLMYIAVFAYLVWWLTRKSLRARLATAPFFAWTVFALCAASVTAIGRSNVQDLTQAMTPRYITFSQLGWLGIMHSLNIVVQKSRSGRRNSTMPWLRLIQALVVCGFIAAYFNGVRGMKWLSGQIEAGRLALLAHEENLGALRKIYVDPSQLLKEFKPALESYQLGPFRK